MNETRAISWYSYGNARYLCATLSKVIKILFIINIEFNIDEFVVLGFIQNAWFLGILGFLVSKFQKSFSCFLGKLLFPYYQNYISCLLEDIDPILRFSRTFKTDLHDLSVPIF